MSQLLVDDIVNKDDTGAPGFSKGVIVTGVTTSTSVVVGAAVTINSTGVDVGEGSITSTGGVNVTAGVSTFTQDVKIGAGATTAVFDVTGKVGLGTVSPITNLHIYGDDVSYAIIESGNGDYNPMIEYKNADQRWRAGLFGEGADAFRIVNQTTGSIPFIISTGNQVLLNTTNNGSNAEPVLIVSGRANAETDSGILYVKRGTAAASLSAADALGEITFSALDGGPAAQILAKAWTGWGGTADCPGNLIFKTAADGGNAPLDRMNIDSDGIIHTTSGPADGVTEMRLANSNMSLADDATYTTTNSSINTAALVCVTTNKTNSGGVSYPGALFFVVYGSATIVKIADPQSQFDVTDTDGKMCIYKSASNPDFTVKNRQGQTNAVSINIIGLRGM